MFDLEFFRLADESCDLMALLERLANKVLPRSTRRADDQNSQPVSPAARNRFRGLSSRGLARQRNQERDRVNDQEQNDDFHGAVELIVL